MSILPQYKNYKVRAIKIVCIDQKKITSILQITTSGQNYNCSLPISVMLTIKDKKCSKHNKWNSYILNYFNMKNNN